MKVFVLTALVVIVVSSPAFAQSILMETPTEMIRRLDNRCNALHTSPRLTPQEEAENAALKRSLLEETFDIRELSRLALGQHWSTISRNEQDHFVDLLKRLLERRALFAAEQAREKKCHVYRITYLGDTYLNPEKTESLTRTKVFLSEEDVTLQMKYKLKKSSGNWKFYDVIVDDASLLENYRYQFDKIITQKGFKELVERLERKWESLQ